MRLLLLVIVVTALNLAQAPAQVRDDAKEVVVVYNSRLPESKDVADYYAKRRDIPANQVWGFATSTQEQISRNEFTTTLQQPLVQKLESENLWRFGPGIVNGTNSQDKLIESKIRYVVLCYGIPLKIARDGEIKDEKDEKLRPELRRNEAAVDSELATLPMVKLDLPLDGPLRNSLYATTNEASLNPTNGVLMVTRLDGPTPEIARGLVDKALYAEQYGMWGRAYFDLRGLTNTSYKTGDTWIRSAEQICRLLGFETVEDDKPTTFPASFPMSHIAFYCGWYDLNASGPFTLPKVEFMPGAFAYHLHSFSAATLRSTTEHWVGPLLAKGATISMGCVYEPYLGGTPEVGVFASRLIFHRFTFGEAACAAQPVLSWQTTVVGDPLYRPFAKAPAMLHLQLASEHNPLIEWSHLRVVDMMLARKMPAAQAINYLEQTDDTRKSAVLSEKLADLCEEVGKPSSAIYNYQQALKLDPSPQQRIRLRLTLGEKLSDAGQTREAYEDYQKLLDESPDYPGTEAVYRKLLALARTLGKKKEIARWEEKIKALTGQPAEPTLADSDTLQPTPKPQPTHQAKPQSAPPPVGPVGPVGPASVKPPGRR